MATRNFFGAKIDILDYIRNFSDSIFCLRAVFNRPPATARGPGPDETQMPAGGWVGHQRASAAELAGGQRGTGSYEREMWVASTGVPRKMEADSRKRSALSVV